MQVHSILNEFVDVTLQVEAKVTVSQAEILKIVFITNLKRFQSCHIHTTYFVDEIGLLQGTDVVDDLQGRDVDTLRLEVTADVVGREEVPHIIGRIKNEGLQKIYVADTFPFDDVLEQNRGEDITLVLFVMPNKNGAMARSFWYD